MTRYGLQLLDFSWIVDADPATTMDRLRDVTAAAEEAGHSSLWVMDHLLQLPPLGGPTAPDPRGLHDARRAGRPDPDRAAGDAGHRCDLPQPVAAAKQIATLDSLSGGRGHPRHRRGMVRGGARGLRLGVPPVRERSPCCGRRSPSAAACLDEETFTYTGEHFHVVGRRAVPRPLRHIPIMIGGSGEKVTLRLVGRAGRPVQHRRHRARRHPEAGRPRRALQRPSGGIPPPSRRTAMVSLFVCANESDRDRPAAAGRLRQPRGVRPDDHRHGRRGHRSSCGALVTAGVDEIIVNLPSSGTLDAFHTAASVLRDATKLNRQPLEAGFAPDCAARLRRLTAPPAGLWRGCRLIPATISRQSP